VVERALGRFEPRHDGIDRHRYGPARGDQRACCGMKVGMIELRPAHDFDYHI
jgi:hypothetical protein